MEADLKQTWAKAQTSIQQMIAQQFVALSQKVLAEWSEETSTDSILKLFKKRIENLSQKQKKEIEKVISKQKVININSSNKLSKKQQDFVITLLKAYWTISQKTKIQFRAVSNLVLGLEVRLGDTVLDWSVKSYLDEMEQNLTIHVNGLINVEK